MIDLVLTYLNQPWGPLGPWLPLVTLDNPWRPLATLGDPWRPLATLGDMLENDQFPHKIVIFKHVGNGQNVSLELISVHQTIMGDPNNGLDEFLVQTS